MGHHQLNKPTNRILDAATPVSEKLSMRDRANDLARRMRAVREKAGMIEERLFDGLSGAAGMPTGDEHIAFGSIDAAFDDISDTLHGIEQIVGRTMDRL